MSVTLHKLNPDINNTMSGITDKNPFIRQGNHGGELYSTAKKLGLKAEDLLDFSSNINMFAEKITEKIIRNTPYPFLHYPDSRCSELHQVIAAHEGLSEEYIIAGNGGAELIWTALSALVPRSILCIGPIFSEYVRAAEAMNIPCEVLRTKPEDGFCCTPQDLHILRESKADLLIICTPNNPAGIVYPNMAAMFEASSAPRILIDTSYREFLYGYPGYEENKWSSYAKLIKPGVSLFCLNSFTKFFCCPGLRLGYMVSDPQSIKRLYKRLPPWTVGTFAQELGCEFLAEIDSYRATLPALQKEQHLMGIQLRQMEIFNSEMIFEGPSFFCCELAHNESESRLTRYVDQNPPVSQSEFPHTAEQTEAEEAAPTLQNALLQKRILVRSCDNIPGMPLGYIRVQVRTDEDNALLLNALAELS